MLRTILLSAWLAASLWAQPSFVAGPIVTNISHGSVRVVWITDSHPSSVEIEWGPTTSYGSIRAALAYNSAPYTSTALISGLSPTTTYHCRARLNGGAVLSNDVVFTTAAEPVPHPALPAAPATVDVAMPTIDGGTYTVAGDCSNLASILTTLAGLTGNANHEVVIPAGTSCYGNWTFPARPSHSGWVVVRSSAAGTSAFPPEGVRWTPNWPAPTTLATFVTRALGAHAYAWTRYIPTGSCATSTMGEGAFFGAYGEPAGEFPLLRCSDNYPAYTGDPLIDSMSGSQPVTITATGHGLTDGQVISVPANGYIPAQIYYVYGTTADTFQVSATRLGSYTGGVSFTVLNQYRLAPHTKSQSDPTGACSEEQWHFNSSNGKMWWCVQGAWVQFELRAPSDENTATLKISGAKYRFMGLEVTGQQVAGAPDSFPTGWNEPSGYYNQQGVLMGLVYVTADQVIFDRCYIHGQDKPARFRKGIALYAGEFALIESYMDRFQEWRTGDYNDVGGATDITHYQRGPVLLRNSFLEAAGINYFAPNPPGDGTPSVHDGTFLRNTFKKRPEWRRTGSQPYQYPNRHSWELKQGQRHLLEGNRFDYGWSGINAGGFLMVTPRCPYQMPPPYNIASWNGSTITLAGTGYFTAGDVIYITGTDTAHNGLWEVASSGCPANCLEATLAGNPAGAGTGGTAQVRAFGLAITDLEIRHNSFYQGTEFLRLLGPAGACGSTFWLPQHKRFRIHNNLLADLNVRRYSDGGRIDLNGAFASWGDFGARFVYAMNGDFEDITVMHNTFYGARGAAPTMLVSDANVSEGLVLSDNLMTFDESSLVAIRGGSAYGTSTLNERFRRGSAPHWTSTANGMCCGWSSYASQYPSGFYWPATVSDIRWLAPSLAVPYDFRLRYDSPYISGGTNRASDDRDVGVDMDALEAAQGRVSNVRVHSLSPSSATIAYLTPDSAACTVEYGTSATWGTGTRVSDGGGDRARNVPVSGLTSRTPYHYRVLCAVEQPAGSFLTP